MQSEEVPTMGPLERFTRSGPNYHDLDVVIAAKMLPLLFEASLERLATRFERPFGEQLAALAVVNQEEVHAVRLSQWPLFDKFYE
jgi:hypothetical protein